MDALYETVCVCMKNTPYPATDTRHLQTASNPHPRVFSQPLLRVEKGLISTPAKVRNKRYL